MLATTEATAATAATTATTATAATATAATAAAAAAAADSTTSTSTIRRVRGRTNHRDYDVRLERDREREFNCGGGGLIRNQLNIPEDGVPRHFVTNKLTTSTQYIYTSYRFTKNNRKKELLYTGTMQQCRTL